MRFRSARVLLPAGEQPACVEVEAGRITAILAWDAPGRVTYECGERVLMSGVVDTHVHCNEPGRTEWEGFRTATRAAAAGGVTTIVDMPLNSIPATTTADAVRTKVAALSGQIHVDVGLWGGVIPGNGDVVVIDRPAGNFVVTVRTTTAAVQSLYSTEYMVVTGSLVIAGEAALAGHEHRRRAQTFCGHDAPTLDREVRKEVHPKAL